MDIAATLINLLEKNRETQFSLDALEVVNDELCFVFGVISVPTKNANDIWSVRGSIQKDVDPEVAAKGYDLLLPALESYQGDEVHLINIIGRQNNFNVFYGDTNVVLGILSFSTHFIAQYAAHKKQYPVKDGGTAHHYIISKGAITGDLKDATDEYLDDVIARYSR